MYKIYFKQALQMLKQNLFISTISILGTALAIMMIMAIIVSEEVKTVSLAPESNRGRMYFINWELQRDTVKGHSRSGTLEYATIKEYLLKLQVPEAISVYSSVHERNKSIVSMPGSPDNLNLAVRNVDATYWRIQDFRFISGKPFSEEEFQSGVPCAVVSERIARELLKGEDPLGKTIEVRFKPYRIVGVVKEVSPVFKNAYADVWIPYTSNVNYEEGRYQVMLLAKDNKDFPAMYAEVRKMEQQFGVDHTPSYIFIKGPENLRVASMNEVWGNSEEEVQEKIDIQNRKRVFILVVLLLVPAVNLSGFSLSRIKKRTSEIGARKAFGAKKYVILTQVLYENFLTSIIGGVLGLLFSYVVVYQMKEWLLKVPADAVIPVQSLVSPMVFLAVFAACVLLNLLSAGIPAYRASRMSIIDSLNQNDHKS